MTRIVGINIGIGIDIGKIYFYRGKNIKFMFFFALSCSAYQYYFPANTCKFMFSFLFIHPKAPFGVLGKWFFEFLKQPSIKVSKTWLLQNLRESSG